MLYCRDVFDDEISKVYFLSPLIKGRRILFLKPCGQLFRVDKIAAITYRKPMSKPLVQPSK